ncbi:hypothetical protein Pmar_PMAR012038 [Perkinsus marinus ATCC 50983]|uniref:RxLR effector protein n=1 Tax=Perkinsus marinus (strain ATCC 50983 / TXsc) TaxID=423536 RepID=C5LW93_PERM5|nr:hypothetical protein Pmar_PMAR012038 [Perkinsus marinus ATCC 50983]EEQ99030.1 hypothetical protein Pmar_PMAR012038 [Perkinsus marinus ATCC 50983]|eukprot:XP_002766313.1 hypothetical protein Pmar_PMAR012038 [Perkinsus marinus ATCC 50983]
MSIISRLPVILMMIILFTVTNASTTPTGVSTELENLVSSLRARQASKYSTTKRSGSAVLNKGVTANANDNSEGLSKILRALEGVVTGRRSM